LGGQRRSSLVRSRHAEAAAADRGRPERYAWVNTTFFIGEGRILPGVAVEYRVSRPA
jgi:hypothetical protein